MGDVSFFRISNPAEDMLCLFDNEVGATGEGDTLTGGLEGWYEGATGGV